MTPTLGLDFGGVIHAMDASDTFLGGSDEQARHTPAVAGTFDAVAELVALFHRRVWIVSKCGPRIEGRTRDWLAFHRFFDRTGLPADHLRICRKRPEKADHCAAIGITHFVDDRRDVLGHLDGVVEHRYLFAGEWFSLIAEIVATLPATRSGAGA